MSSIEQSDNDDLFNSILSQNTPLSGSGLSLDQWHPKCFGSLSLNDPVPVSKGTGNPSTQHSLLQELNQNSDFFGPVGNTLNFTEWREERNYPQYDPKPSSDYSYNSKSNLPSYRQSASSSWGTSDEMSRSSNSLQSEYDSPYTQEYDRPPHRLPSSYNNGLPNYQPRMTDYYQNDWMSNVNYSEEDQKYSRGVGSSFYPSQHPNQRPQMSLPRPKNPSSGYPSSLGSLGRQNGPRLQSNDMKRDSDLEASIVYCTRLILFETPNRCLKSVELANALRDRIGKDGLQRAKSVYGGLLVLLELYPEIFFVHRIPKNDMVELIDLSVPYPPFQLQNRASVPDQSYRRVQAPQFMYHASHFPPLNVENTRPSPQFSTPPVPVEEKIPERLTQIQMPLQSTDQFILLNDIPENVTGGDLWKEFGGNGIVHKVSLDYQSNKRTGTIYFTSAEAARKAFQQHSIGRWKNNLVYSHAHSSEDTIKFQSGEKDSHNGQSTEVSPNDSETRLVTVRGDQLPEFFQDVLANLRDITFIPHMKWKRSIIADYLFCQVMTDMLRQQCGSGMPIQVSKLQQQLRESFGGGIGLAPLKAMLVAYPEYFEVDADVNIVRPIKSELPSLDGLDGLSSTLS